MKPIPAAVLAALFVLASAHAATPERYQVERVQVELYTAPGDDMRPRIVGTVIATDAAGATLAGGARVPAQGAKPGDLATFACQAIDEGSPPTSTACELVDAQHPDQDRGALW